MAQEHFWIAHHTRRNYSTPLLWDMVGPDRNGLPDGYEFTAPNIQCLICGMDMRDLIIGDPDDISEEEDASGFVEMDPCEELSAADWLEQANDRIEELTWAEGHNPKSKIKKMAREFAEEEEEAEEAASKATAVPEVPAMVMECIKSGMSAAAAVAAYQETLRLLGQPAQAWEAERDELLRKNQALQYTVHDLDGRVGELADQVAAVRAAPVVQAPVEPPATLPGYRAPLPAIPVPPKAPSVSAVKGAGRGVILEID